MKTRSKLSLMLSAAALLCAMAMTSCTTCTTCSYTYQDPFFGIDTTITFPETCGSKADIEGVKESWETTATAAGATLNCIDD